MFVFSFQRNVLCCILHDAFRWNAGQDSACCATHKMFRWNRGAFFCLLIFLNVSSYLACNAACRETKRRLRMRQLDLRVNEEQQHRRKTHI